MILFLLLSLTSDIAVRGQPSVAAEVCDTALDLIIAIDSSGSVSNSYFDQAKNALVSLVSNLVIGPKKVMVSVINYATNVEEPIHFKHMQYNNVTLQWLTDEIRALKPLGGMTHTGDALRTARVMCDQYCRPFNTGTARTVIVFTDGQSNGGVPVGPEAEQLTYTTNANVFAIGIGASISNVQLQQIASEPHYTVQLSNYLQLTQMINAITRQACDFPAYILPEIVVKSEVEVNAYRYYQINTNMIAKTGGYVVINAKVSNGVTRVFTSTEHENPKLGTDPETRISAIERGNQNIYMPLEAGVRKFFFSVYGVQPINQYEFTAHIYKLDGSIIG
jgi:uncharacterized protein YegL